MNKNIQRVIYDNGEEKKIKNYRIGYTNTNEKSNDLSGKTTRHIYSGEHREMHYVPILRK